MTICDNCKSRMKVLRLEDMGIPVVFLDAEMKPYRAIYGDKVTCEDCGNVVFTNFSDKDFHQGDPNFQAIVTAKNAVAIPARIVQVK